MSLGSSLYHARKKSGLTQENVAEKLGVSRQTISKWETNETLPDIRQSKGLAQTVEEPLFSLSENRGSGHSLGNNGKYDAQIGVLPTPICQLFQIHCSIFKPNPPGNGG